MKKKITNAIAALAVIAGFVVSMTAPWWMVWTICLPVIFAGAVTLLKLNTNYITEE